MTDTEHKLRQLPSRSDGAKKVKYYVVEDITLTSTPPVSGVLGSTLAEDATPDWVRKLFETGKVD